MIEQQIIDKANYCLNCINKPCSTKGCPMHTKIPEFISLASTLSNWKQEIANSFVLFDGFRVSNGPIEGRNSLIKKVLKLANGYSNFTRFRNRVMYCLNRFSSHSFPHD